MLTGAIDDADRARIRGWARDPDYPDSAVSLLITADGRLLERVVANRKREDLAAARIGHGRFGFEVTFNPPLLPTRSWLIHVRAEADGQDVPGSPVRIDPASDFDEAAQAAFAAALGQFSTPGELRRRLAFLTAQRDRLLQMQVVHSNRKGRRALVVDGAPPRPGRDGGSTALLSHMQSLQRLGFDVTFVAQSMAGEAGLAALGIECCHSPDFASVEEVMRRSAGGFAVVYLHRVGVAAAYTGLVRQYQPGARLVYGVADLHHERVARQAVFEDRPELGRIAERLRGEEWLAAVQADAVITHSAAEAERLRQVVPGEKVHVVAWGMPCRARRTRLADRWGLAFIGNFSHAPNVAAALWLRDEIMPRVKAVNPALTCRLVGDGLPEALRLPHPALDVAGPVADLDDLLNAVRLTVAPLPYGAGLKAKVAESFAAGVACVCSPVAAEGFDLPPGLQGLVGGDGAAIARLILLLHEDLAANQDFADAALAFARERFSDWVVDGAMAAVVG